jgi:hypothetical protein
MRECLQVWGQAGHNESRPGMGVNSIYRPESADSGLVIFYEFIPDAP